MISCELELPKTDLGTTFLNRENQSFENISIVAFKKMFDIPLLNNLFVSFLNLLVALIELKTFFKKIDKL